VGLLRESPRILREGSKRESMDDLYGGSVNVAIRFAGL
jgi:hypothetical protein